MDEPSPTISTIRIKTPAFKAAVVLAVQADRITLAHPIVRYMIGWNEAQFMSFMNSRRWDIESVTDEYT